MSVAPCIYLLGDSIAAGYTERVRPRLAGEFEVAHNPENGKDSVNLLAHAAGWLAGRQWTVIHFNCGLHDIKRPLDSDPIQVPLEQYERNLRRLLVLLRPLAAQLVWARTTPVRDGRYNRAKSFNRFNHDVDAYNQVADAIMQAEGIPINDLHGAVDAAGHDTCIGWDGVHMTEAGYAVLADQVMAAVRRAAER